MVCCLFAALMVVVVHRLLPWRSPPTDAGFAPVAFRSVLDEGAGSAGLGSPGIWLDRRTAVVAWTLRFVGIGAALYLAGSALVLWLGHLHSAAPTWVWIVRSAATAVVALVALTAAARRHRSGADPSSQVQIVAAAAFGSGLVFLLLMELDMHVLQLYHVHDSQLHTALHGSALTAMAIGALLLVAARNTPAQTVVSHR